MWFVYSILLGLFVALVVWLNATYRQGRQRMTPEQRRKKDEQQKFDQSVW